MAYEDLVAALVGQWHLDRQISNGAMFRGRAVWSEESSDRLHYREDGLMHLQDGRSFGSYRSYLFVRAKRGIEVLFDEAPPRLFHFVALTRAADGQWHGDGVHLCGQDRYETHYELGPRPKIVHTIKGPRKDYRMVGIYTRLVSAGQTVR